MRFRKLGRVFVPDGTDPLAVAYAILPTPMVLDDVVRVFYASTDSNIVGRVFWVDLDAGDLTRVVGRSDRPVLDSGSEGAFDQYGVNPISVVRDGPDLRLYYAGYQRPGGDVPYTLFAGLAVSGNDGLRFDRASVNPVLPPTPKERFIRTAPNVQKDFDRWRVWYVGGSDWTTYGGKRLPIYGLRYSESGDGIAWSDPALLLDPDRSRDQIGFGRPWVLKENGAYRMFLSVRTVHGYSISHARSNDGLVWHDWHHNIIPTSVDGWDRDMCCYAASVNVDGQEFVFYNGNGYGRDGFGLAIREA